MTFSLFSQFLSLFTAPSEPFYCKVFWGAITIITIHMSIRYVLFKIRKDYAALWVYATALLFGLRAARAASNAVIQQQQKKLDQLASGELPPPTDPRQDRSALPPQRRTEQPQLFETQYK